MTSVLDLLDARPPAEDARGLARWRAELEESLDSHAGAWVREVGGPGSEQLSRDRAWVLLSWAEDAAEAIVNQRRDDLLRRTALALSLLEASPLDRRDVMVVGLLLRRASTLAGLDFDRLVTAGCRDAEELGESCRPWLSRVVDTSPSAPTTHDEVREGSTLRFRRKPQDIDTERLARWLGEAGGAGPMRDQ